MPYYFGILILSAILAAIYYYAERRNINFGAVIFASAATYLLARAVLGVYVHLGAIHARPAGPTAWRSCPWCR